MHRIVRRARAERSSGPHPSPRRSSVPGRVALTALVLASLLGASSGAIAQPLDPDEPTEFPYERCLEAEAIGAIAVPYTIEDALEDGDESTQVDFFSLSTEPGTALVVELRGQSSGAGSLPDPLLGLFDTDCERLAYNDDWYSLDSRLEFTVPESGGFVLAAAAFPDIEFDGSGSAFGSYRLSVVERPAPIDSIAVRVVDARSHEALRGDASPGARVALIGCREEDLVCDRYIVALNANSEGRVRFDSASVGQELLAGNYALVAGSGRLRVDAGRAVRRRAASELRGRRSRARAAAAVGSVQPPL